MQKFMAWYEKGEYAPYGKVFDVGISTRKAFRQYADGVAPIQCGGAEENDNGNGALMRILPLAFTFHAKYSGSMTDEAFEVTHTASSLTHGHLRSQMACGIYLAIAVDLLGENGSIQSGLRRAKEYYGSKDEYAAELTHYNRIYGEGFHKLPEKDIKSTGYVVDSLEAALWCLLTTDSYRACVLKAVNLGEDTDTVAAIAGGLAGILYGTQAIPEAWLGTIPRLDYIKELCAAFWDSTGGR